MFSMNIRSTTVALATPDRLRGRVSAVEMVFLSASNQLGAFESGLAAFLVGTVPAVVGGGAITVLIAVSWSRFFPELARVDRMQDLRRRRRAGEPMACSPPDGAGRLRIRASRWCLLGGRPGWTPAAGWRAAGWRPAG